MLQMCNGGFKIQLNLSIKILCHSAIKSETLPITGIIEYVSGVHRVFYTFNHLV